MKRKDRAIFFAGALVALNLMSLDPEPDSGGQLGWTLYGMTMAALVFGLYRAVTWTDPSWKPQRHSRSHWTDDEIEID